MTATEVAAPRLAWRIAEVRAIIDETPRVRPRVLADHLAHVVRVGGPGAACLGSDFDGVSELPEGMDDVADLPRLFDELSRRELPVAAIAGENVLRVLEAQAGG